MKKAKALAGGLTVAAATWLAAGLGAQATQPARGPQLGNLLSSWRAENGSAWQVRAGQEHSFARMLYGGSTAARSTPVTDADFVALARGYVDDVQAMFAIPNDQLTEREVAYLPLAQIGSSDKIAVDFAQSVNGVPVEQGSVTLLFDTHGGLLSVDANALPAAAGFDTVPTIDAQTALNVAVRDFREQTGTPVTSSGLIELNVVKTVVPGGVVPTLAWRVQLWNETEGFVPESYVYQLAAQGEPSIVRRDDAIHHFDVGGTVRSNTTPGNRPDVANNGETQELMRYMTVTATGLGTTTTDVNGNFNFTGSNGPVSVTFRYDGTYNNVDNSAGAEYTLTQTLSGTGNSVLLNPAPTELLTAQANVFARINQMRDWTRATSPTDGHMDFVNLANTNINSNCNAFYDGSSTNYYTSGGGCVNTAYSTVVWHEQGHWQNDRYSSGNGFDGFGEGNADVFAMYIGNTPIVGEEFFGQGGGFIRTGTNLRQYCGDGNNGCYGQVHADGEVLMGALWKVRANLQSTHGSTTGGSIADQLFLGWMNAYNQTTINSIIETQWLTLDDNNGNIGDGTPNYNDINDAFLVQGFPGVVLNGAPIADFTADVTLGGVPLTVNFSDISGGNPGTAWSWTFGDGGTSTVQNPQHVYTLPGTYDVSLEVTNNVASDDVTKVDFIVAIPAGPGSTSVYNGNGINPVIFTSVNNPVIGQVWTSKIAGGTVGANSGLAFVFGFLDELNPPLLLNVGELLIDVSSPFAVLNTSVLIGGTSTHNQAVPFDISLVGTTIATQGVLNNVGGAALLCNALILTFGTF